MLKIGMTVRTPDGVTGAIDRTSTRFGSRLFRIADRWFEAKYLEPINGAS